MQIEHAKHKHIKSPTPFYGERVFDVQDSHLLLAFDLLNKNRLFRVGFGYSAKNQDKAEHAKLIEDVVLPKYEDMKKCILEKKLLNPIMLYGYYKTITQDDILYIVDGEQKHSLPLERSNVSPYKSIVDFFDANGDIIGLSMVSLGFEYHNYVASLYENSEYKDYYFFHALGTYLVESFVSILHSHLEDLLGFDRVGEWNKDKHVGCRYSFGYKALSDLSGNAVVYNLLKCCNHNILLTDTFMLEPELSTCAILSFCEEAHYFTT